MCVQQEEHSSGSSGSERRRRVPPLQSHAHGARTHSAHAHAHSLMSSHVHRLCVYVPASLCLPLSPSPSPPSSLLFSPLPERRARRPSQSCARRPPLVVLSSSGPQYTIECVEWIDTTPDAVSTPCACTTPGRPSRGRSESCQQRGERNTHTREGEPELRGRLRAGDEEGEFELLHSSVIHTSMHFCESNGNPAEAWPITHSLTVDAHRTSACLPSSVCECDVEYARPTVYE
jgi:hypothetical protein